MTATNVSVIALISVSLLMPVTAFGQVTLDQLAGYQKRIDAAALAGDAAALEATQSKLGQETGSGVEADLLEYYRAYVSYRRAELATGDKKTAKRQLNACIDTLRDLVERRPSMAEAHALRATCYGASTQYYMLRAAGRGMASGKAMDRALALEPENPRVVFQHAMSYYGRPAAFGGDKAVARERFKEAAELFSDWQPPGPGWPSWGEAETWVFIARLDHAAGETESARRAYAKALDLAPNFQAAQEEQSLLR